jgi:hypothetical protein
MAPPGAVLMSGFTDPFDGLIRRRVAKAASQYADADDLILVASDSNRPPPGQLAVALLGVERKLKAAPDDQSQRAAPIVRHSASILNSRAEVFEFGDVPDATLRDNAVRAGPLLGRGMISTPFPACIFWYSLVPDIERTREQLRQIGADEAEIDEVGSMTRRYCSIVVRVIGPGHGEPGHECDSQSFVVGDFMRLTVEEAVALRLPSGSVYFALDALGLVTTTAKGTWEGYLLDSMAERLPRYKEADESIRGIMRQMSLGSLADGVASAAMMLTTRGIKTRVEEAPAKLNAKRLKAGKAPLPRVTVVDTAAYVAASDRTSRGGHHASPVPHLRRGHVRRLRSGRQTWIRDMLVNCRSLSEVSARDHYEVKREKTE